MKIKILSGVLTGVFLCWTADSARAASVTWNFSGTDFNTGANWSGGLPGTGDNAVFFGAAGVNQPDLSANITIQGLTYGNTASSGYVLSRTAGSLTLTNVGTGASSAINALNTSGANTISAPIILGGAAASTATFTQAAGGHLVLSGDISSTNAIAGLTLAGGNGRIFTLSGSNSYSGNTSTSSNVGITLNINNASALSSGALVLGVNLSVDNTTASAITLANNNDINLTGGSLTFVGTKDLSFGSGVVTLGGNRTITTTAGVLTVGSIDADTTGRTFTKAGAGTLAITGAAGTNFQGGFLLSAGTALIGNKAALGTGLLTVSGGSTLSASADLSGANAVANDVALNANLTLGGANNLTLSGAVTLNNNRTITASNTGDTLLFGPIYLSDTAGTGRTLTLAGAQALTVSGAIANFNGVGTAGGVTISNSSTVTLSNAASSYSGPTSVTGANAVLQVSKLADGGNNSSIGASSSAASNLSLSNNTTLRYVGSGDTTDRLFTIAGSNAGHNATLDASGSGAIQFTNTGGLAYGTNNQTRTLFLTGSNTGNNTLAAALANNGSGATTITKNGTGTWVLSGTNTYTGNTTINNGTLQFAQRVSLYNGGTSSWTNAAINTQSGATTAFNVGGSGEFTSADIDLLKDLGSASAGFNNGSFIGLDTSNAGGVFTYGSVIADTNSGANSLGLKKLGSGTLELTGNNTYTGATSVNAGTLLIQGAQTGTGLVTVESGGAIGGDGSIAGSLSILSGADFVFSPTETLTVNGTNVTFGGFSIANLIGLDGTAALGTYTLINGSATVDFTNVANFGLSNATAIGGGKSAYFQGSDFQVVVIPEPATAALLISGLAGAFLLRRRR